MTYILTGNNGFSTDNVIFTGATYLTNTNWSLDKDALYYAGNQYVFLPSSTEAILGDQVNFVAAWAANNGVELYVEPYGYIRANGTAYYNNSSIYARPTSDSNFPRYKIYRFIYIGSKTWMLDEG